MMRRYAYIAAAIGVLLMASCSGGQFAGWQTEVFGTTPVTGSATMTVVLGNASSGEEQHLRAASFVPSSNAQGHFRIDSLEVGDRQVAPTDIVVPPGSVLKMTVTYAPLNLETTVANYGGWITGQPELWGPRPVEGGDGGKGSTSGDSDGNTAVHRALMELVYDSPREGIVYVQLVGKAIPGPDGEIAAGGMPGECYPGNGAACYTGGFALDIPALAPGGPKDLVLDGAVRFGIAGGAASLRMDDFPPALMYLRSEEIPQLPSGVTATLIITGAPGVTAEGTFDGSRLELDGVAFRIRVVLGEIGPDTVTPGMPALVDFVIDGLEITTTEPFAQGNITLHLETTLSESPSGNDLFDQFLSGAEIMVMMQGQLAF